tara:strand:- start:615 stop:2924 length:2310 start_codon:yes stop_codon:yes gene_type:complete
MNEKLIEFYGLLKDKGLTDSQIDAAFQEHVGMSLDDVRKMFSPGQPAFDEMIPDTSQSRMNEEIAARITRQHPDSDPDDAINDVVDRLRMIGQGALYGGADELEAGVRAALDPNTTYEAELQTVRDEIEKFRLENPGTSLAYEVGGSFVLPGFVIGRIAQLPGLALKVGQPFRNALRRLGAGAASGGVAGATYGLGASDPDPELSLGESVDERIEGALESGWTGAKFGLGMTPANVLIEKVAGRIANKMGGGAGQGPPPIKTDGTTPPGGRPSDESLAEEGRNAILRSMERDNIPISDLEKTMDEIIEMGLQKNMTVAEMLGAQGQGMAQVASRAPGVGPQLARDSFEGIGQGAKEQARRAVVNMDPSSPTPRVKDYKQSGEPYFGKNVFQTEMTNLARAKAQPFYDIADPIPFKNNILADQINHAMKRDDSVGKVIRKAFGEAKGNIGVRQGVSQNVQKHPPYKIWDDKVEGIKPILHWHELMKAIDQQLTKFSTKSPALSTAAGQIRTLKNSIGESISKSSGEGGKAFQKAQSIYAEKGVMVDAFKLGKDANMSDIPATAVRSMLQKLQTDAEKKFFRWGFAHNLHQKITANNTKTPDMDKVISAYSLENQDKIRVVLGQNAENFMKKFNTIAKRGILSGKLLQGSPTAPLQMIERDLKGGPGMVERAKELFRMGKNPLDAGVQIDDILSQKRLERKLETMSPMFFNRGPQATRATIQQLKAQDQINRQRMADPSHWQGRSPATVAPLLDQDPEAALRGFQGLMGNW